jgi:opacity protein-like surface antigen
MRKAIVGSCIVAALAFFLAPKRANAMINVGAEGGIVKRSADSPFNLKLGIGYGAHGELDLFPLLKLGPYYLHYELSSADKPAFGAADATFNVLGLRARLTLPIPGSYKPYAFAGVGYTWVNYTPVGTTVPAGGVTVSQESVGGHFFETPLGVGIAYEVIEIFQLSLDAAWRPAFGFGGDAYGSTTSGANPASGWSVLLGASLNL